MSKYQLLDFNNIKTYSLKNRKSKVNLKQFVQKVNTGKDFKIFLNNLPDILSGKDFKNFLSHYKKAITTSNQSILMMGAHVIKVGLGPLLIDAMRKGWITHLAMNGACIIHDVELAMSGHTSEDVLSGLKDGSFGMAEETAQFINSAVHHGKGKLGYAESVAENLSESSFKWLNYSILYAAYQLDIPVTAHPAIGTEIIHQHKDVDGAAIGDTAYRDFKIFSHSIAQLNHNAVVMNVGSAVIMPEVFLKALTVARNLGYDAYGFSTATFDMQKHYRPDVNVVKRPTSGEGKGYYFIGHHEIMIPLLFSALNSLLSD